MIQYRCGATNWCGVHAVSDSPTSAGTVRWTSGTYLDFASEAVLDVQHFGERRGGGDVFVDEVGDRLQHLEGLTEGLVVRVVFPRVRDHVLCALAA